MIVSPYHHHELLSFNKTCDGIQCRQDRGLDSRELVIFWPRYECKYSTSCTWLQKYDAGPVRNWVPPLGRHSCLNMKRLLHFIVEIWGALIGLLRQMLDLLRSWLRQSVPNRPHMKGICHKIWAYILRAAPLFYWFFAIFVVYSMYLRTYKLLFYCWTCLLTKIFIDILAPVLVEAKLRIRCSFDIGKSNDVAYI